MSEKKGTRRDLQGDAHEREEREAQATPELMWCSDCEANFPRGFEHYCPEDPVEMHGLNDCGFDDWQYRYPEAQEEDYDE